MLASWIFDWAIKIICNSLKSCFIQARQTNKSKIYNDLNGYCNLSIKKFEYVESRIYVYTYNTYNQLIIMQVINLKTTAIYDSIKTIFTAGPFVKVKFNMKYLCVKSSLGQFRRCILNLLENTQKQIVHTLKWTPTMHWKSFKLFTYLVM